MFTSIIKAAACILTVLELWLLLQVPAVGDAAFSFVVGGEVPGTDKVLSMRQMGLLLTGMFILATGVLFQREINRALNRIGGRAHKEADPELTALPDPVVEQPARQVRRRRFPTVVQWPKGVLRAQLVRGGQFMSRRSATLAPKAGAILRRAQQLGVWMCAMEVYLAYRAWVALRTGAVRVWRWSRPYIERCDRWIDRKLHQNDVTADLLSIGRELATTVRELVGRRPMR